jgi:hypothetical protein
MTESSEAQQRLDAIHHLLERENLYRAVSAATALVAGTLSLVASAFFVWRLESTGSRVMDMNLFVGIWVAVLVLSLLVGGSLLLREARGRSEPLLSPAVRLVSGTVAPFLITAVALGLVLSWRGAAYSLCVTWVTLYGLALIASSHFAPRAVANLGWSFLITGVSLMLFVHLRIRLLIGYDRSDVQSALIMGATFGLFHLLYAFITWAQMRREEISRSGG